jgi:hypothetical protein
MPGVVVQRLAHGGAIGPAFHCQSTLGSQAAPERECGAGGALRAERRALVFCG